MKKIESNEFKANDNKKPFLSENFDSPAHNFDSAGHTIQPYIPFLKIITDTVESLSTAHECANCNKKICSVLIDRVELAKQAVNSLQRELPANVELFRNQTYYNSWVRFITVLGNINKFCEEITQLSTLQKYVHATAVKEEFDRNVKEFEETCNNLHFRLDIHDQKRREIETQKITEDIEIMKKVMRSDKELIIEEFPAPRINSNDIEICLDSGKSIVKGIYRGIEVACKRNPLITRNDKVQSLKYQTELSILRKLGFCRYIISFLGISQLNDCHVMVFEWAHNGNLKSLYTNNSIHWYTKLKIARDICNGLVFIQRCNILHHDLRCENILITEAFEPKISNFVLSRTEKDESVEVKSILNIIRWLAPEKMRDSQYYYDIRYDYQCEMFSFGMLLWELCHQKIPYENMTVFEILDHVKGNKRETMNMTHNSHPIPLEFAKIITKAWEDKPSKRPSIMEVLATLKDLYENHVPKGTSFNVTPKGIPSPVIGHETGSTSKNYYYSIDENTFGLPEDCSELTLDNFPTFHT